MPDPAAPSPPLVETAAAADALPAGADLPQVPDAPATGGADSATPLASAVTDVWSHLRLWAVVATGLAIDLWSKEWAFRTLGQGGGRELIPSVLEFHTTLNPGALFGIGAGRTGLFLVASAIALLLVVWMFAQSARSQRWTHIALGAILAGALGNMYDRIFVQLVPYTTTERGIRSLRYYVPQPSSDGSVVELHEFPLEPGKPPIALRPREDGADDLRPVGYVRDFIKIPTRWLGRREIWPWVFNVADMLLVGGVGVLAIRMLRERPPRGRGPDQTPAAA